MSGSQRRHHDFMKSLQQRAVKKAGERIELLKTLAVRMVGRVESRDGRLSRMAEQVPLEVQEDGVAQRFRRWLKNPWVDERAIYEPGVAQLLGGLRHMRLPIQMDWTLIDQRFNSVMVSLYDHKRAIVGQVLNPDGHSHFRERQALLEPRAALMPQGAHVLVLGDRAFGGAEMLRRIRQPGWDYWLRVKGALAV